MAYIDFLIWVGSPGRPYNTIKGYIGEAKELGCCRRVPQVPSWAVPGKSRVFLVHRGDHKKKSDLGSIFGYYTLRRVEVITKQKVSIIKQKNLDSRETYPEPFPWYILVPQEQAGGEEERGCGMRETDGAIYLVNELASEITDVFLKKLEEKPGNKTIYSKERINLFREAKREVVAKRKAKAGELVLFKRPYPIFQRFPKAAFRGYFRIDGDKLLEQINKGGKSVTPKVPYWGIDVKPGKPMTKTQLVTKFASELGLQKIMVNRFLGKLSKLVPDELNRTEAITLPGLGKMVLSKRKARRGVKPGTTEEILIPAKNVVKFRPAKGLSGKIKPPKTQASVK